jgi:hypothetical protein
MAYIFLIFLGVNKMLRKPVKLFKKREIENLVRLTLRGDVSKD